ncbi:hypothetical protein CHGG_00742 [Chaetomium globosum CBS 148.51]|uniref:alpha-amylase n=1 Tax=Chaetomium globosum (strain ATCC 6205 / CBS 148.51 / DSM 1962 / NBRC 6347 / NRRL 1970) TaxID=306901 RepID=Q2HGB2_CHAGB|nr:uncharacterized protein CHGG_00742 [Chaetomium globosum CBS 148.51]EAQ92507.1 hypothetical protein CHGG_00742 [Chaetomium globosum CBS 148.51]
MRHPLLAAAAALCTSRISALPAASWRSQSIYQVVTDRFARTDLSTSAPCDPAAQVYCGGSWRGLIAKLDYIRGMGFTAVWISPVVAQVEVEGGLADGSSYHGYWAKDIWALNAAFGDENDLVELSAELHARDMYLMVDIVTNHMAWQPQASYYHSPCPIDYDSQTLVEVCWQGSDVVSEAVRSVWNEWVTEMVSKYSIDGLRVDSAKHVETSFWSGFSDAAGVYLLGEVFQGDPLYYWILNAFKSPDGSISELVSGLNTLRGVAQDPSLYGSFLENHDIERFPSFTEDTALVKNCSNRPWKGIPIIYQGQEQHYSGSGTPQNREALWSSGYSETAELYTWIAKLNQIRSQAISQDDGYLSYKSNPIYSDSHTIAMRKGQPGAQVVGVFTNVGTFSSAEATLPSSATGFEAGQALVDVMGCTEHTTDSGGGIAVTLASGLPVVLYPKARLSGSGVCDNSTRSL